MKTKIRFFPGLSARNALAGCLLLCLAYSFCRGFYMPSMWSVNYWLPSFFDGFGRRALLGTLLYPFGDWRHHYHFVASIQILTCTALIALILAKLLMWQKNNTRGNFLVNVFLCGFFLSDFGAFFWSTTGYIDYALYLAIFLALLAPNSAARILLSTSTIWMHEAAAFTCLPLYFAIECLYFRRAKTAFATLAASLISFIVIFIFFKTPDPGVIENYKTGFLAHLNYRPRTDYFEQVFAKDSTTFYFVAASHYKYAMIDYALFSLLLASMLAWLLTRSASFSWQGSILAWACSVSPLVLGFLAYDTNRWIFLTIVHISTLFILFQRHMDTRDCLGFIAAAFAVFFSCRIPLIHNRYYRDINEILPFLRDLGKIVASTPFR